MSKLSHSNDETMEAIERQPVPDESGMQEAKHTPGPWECDKVETSCGHCFRIGSPAQLKQMRDTRTVPSYACLYVDYLSYSEQAEANARLLASAPELLKALKRCRPYVVEAANNDGGMGGDGALDMLDAAIAKATMKESGTL